MNENDAKNVPGPGGTAAHAEQKIHGEGSDGSIPVSDEGISLTMTGDESNFNQEEDAGAATNRPDRATPET